MYEELEFNKSGVISINTPKGVAKITTSGLKEELLKIEAVNVLRKAGKNITSKIKDDEALKKLVELIDGDIEVLSYELN